MKTTEWDEAFKPVMALGREVRTGQAQLGQAIFNTINSKGTLVGQAPVGTGKSFSAAIPLITKVLEAKKNLKSFRGVISTGTITLQNQIAEKDLVFLSKLYPGFKYKKLMGRSNYLCLNIAKLSALGDNRLEAIYSKLEARKAGLRAGEVSDVEKVLGIEMTDDLWSRLCGSTKFCADNSCDEENCFAAKARAEALAADIVVINHALLAVDAEMKNGADIFADGILGTIDCLIVDEAHDLEPVLVSQWTEELTQWQINDMGGSVSAAIDFSKAYLSDGNVGKIISDALENVMKVTVNIQTFFERFADHEKAEWARYESAISLKYFSGNVSNSLKYALQDYEVNSPLLIQEAIAGLNVGLGYMAKVQEFLVENYDEQGLKVKNRRKLSKGIRVSKELIKVLEMLYDAIRSKNGVVNNFGLFGVIIKGWVRNKDNTNGMTLEFVPLDVSKEAAVIWKTAGSSVLLSATLMDLTDGTFQYSRKCVGFPDGPEINVTSPFDYKTKQLIYVTSAKGTPVEGSQYAIEELMDLVHASNGRALILFTAKRELEVAADYLRKYRAFGKFPYKILVQEEGENKQKLLEEFKTDTHSVLLGLKSFFVGVDVPGEALSQVIICRFPLARYSVECRMRMAVWASKDFPKWYERESLSTLAQAAGRLIRSSDDHGVVSLLDYRLMDITERVYQTAQIGVKALGSPVTQQIEEVSSFINKEVSLV